ncbi:hypothetical protein JCM10295v2_000203 [Rhodotorula toruloides]
MALKFPVLAGLCSDLENRKSPEALFAEHKEAILAAIDGALRERLHDMIRSIGKAYVELRQDQQDEAKWRDDYIKNLTVASVTLPRLPPWILRDDSTPITATDEQVVAFLESHDLAFFTCKKCEATADGISVVQHSTRRYVCDEDYSTAGGRVLPALDDWARCGRPNAKFDTDKKLLLRALYIKQRLDSAQRKCPDTSLLEEAAKYDVETDENKIYRVEAVCECEPATPWYNGARKTKVADMLSHFHKHVHPDAGKVAKNSIRVDVDYSESFRCAVSSARVRAGVPGAGLFDDPFDFFEVFGRYDSGVYDSYDGYDDDDEGREECSIM